MTQIRNKLNSKSKNQDNSSSNFNEELLDEILKDYNHQNPEELIGSNGLLKQLKKALIQTSLKMGIAINQIIIYRNGHGSKRVITDNGEFNINSPRD
ncbi:MAG: putative transposase [Rickettsiales bacterium]|jgi:putative transposase